MKVRYQESKPVPEGFYLARLDGLEETMHQTYGASIKWTFTIVEPTEYANTTVTAMSSQKVSPKSKLYSWLQAFGINLGTDDDFELNNLLGKMIKVRIKNNTKSSIVDGQERVTTYSNVDALSQYIPAQAPTQAPTQAPAQAPAQAAPVANTVPQQDLAKDEEFDF